MKKKQIVDMIIDTMLILIGIVLLIMPSFGITNIKKIFFCIMVLYAILNLIQFILTRESKDYEGLYSFIISFSVGLTGLTFSFENPIQLALSLLAWVLLMSFAKLIKTNYYNDRNDRMWKLRIFTLLIFIILGILSSINLYNDTTTRFIILGFFFFTHGILELIDPLCKYLISK